MKKSFGLIVVWLLPIFVHAQSGGLKELILGVGSMVNMLIPIATALAVLYFFYGIAKFILNAGSDEKREEGKNVMKWGILALFVIVSIWGIVAFMRSEVGVPDVTDPTIPITG